jgi:hypothetical protein
VAGPNWDKIHVINAEVEKSWTLRGIGDMAVGIWRGDRGSKGRVISKETDMQEIQVVEDFEDYPNFTWDSEVALY